MKNAKRLLSLFLCAAAAASATACSTAGAAANSEAAASSGQDSAVRDEAYYETVTYDEPITISYCTIPVRDGVDYNNDDDYAKWWTEKFNIQCIICSCRRFFVSSSI